jgi:D-alanyl-D-alanine carboxypeptidase (penicillin-binding protein 5/6)
VVGGPLLASPGVVVRPLAGATKLPTIDAESWILVDITTGDVLAAKGAHRIARPASALKTLTAITLLPLLDKNAVRTVTDPEARADGGHVGLVVGGEYTIWDLWHALLLPSANDAAAALADAFGGMSATVTAMQKTADNMQARDTTVKNASGLDADGQLSSAYDLALMARAAMALPDFRAITSRISYDFPGLMPKAGHTRSTYKIYSQNRLLLHGFPGTVGGKTGFTTLAHRTFWGAVKRGGHTLVVALLQIHQPTLSASSQLLTWGFANRTKIKPIGHLVDPLSTAEASEAPSPSDSNATEQQMASGSLAAGNSSADAAPVLPFALVTSVIGGAIWIYLRRRRRAARSGYGAGRAPGAGRQRRDPNAPRDFW